MQLIYILSFLSFLATIYSQSLQSVDSFIQTKERILALNEESTNNFGIVFGIWSKYNPLNKIPQGEIIELMDSNCFHYMNFMRESSKELEILYYDCLYPETQIIQKVLAYNTADGFQHVHKVEIDPLEYENVWYLFELLYSPSTSKLEIIMVKGDQFVLHKLLDVNIIKTENLILTVGSGLIVQNSNIQSIHVGSKFSYFPGQMKLLRVNQSVVVMLDSQILGKAVYVLFFDTISVQQCQENNQYLLQDQDLTWLDAQTFLSQNINTNSFTLFGWYQIKEIQKIDDKFTYQFLKISPNFENEQISNPYLSPFQLFYQISSNNDNKILITTYSYQFPSITSDLSNNLISKEFDILHKLTFWHNLLITLVDDQIFISIKFYDSYDIQEYSVSYKVKQFHNVQFQLKYGNLEESSLNYLHIQTNNQQFYNCQIEIEQQHCHYTCKYCDGPTKTDCLMCSEESSRIYLSEYKSCICPHNYYDDKEKQNCKSYADLELKINQIQIENGCKFGYFEYDDQCQACPSIISNQLTTCIECIKNVKGWMQNAYCQTTLYKDTNGNTVKTISEEEYQYYIFDGFECQICRFCDQQSLSNINNIYKDFNFIVSKFNSFCQTSKTLFDTTVDIYTCYACNLPNCNVCSIEITGIKCILCEISFTLINGICTNEFEFQKHNYSCASPQYINSLGECKKCHLTNCKYCFEFNKNDLSKCTLYANFDKFELDENLSVGCAFCEENFIFDFTIGSCIYKLQTLPNCLRSYINFQKQEICTLSSTDFSFAPEIINCEKLIQNCLQCLLTPQSVVKCIICESGFTTSINQGDCYSNSFDDAKVVIEGQIQIYDAWVQRVQSFMMRFLPDSYFYFRPYDEQAVIQYQIECKEGYKLNDYSECKQYCSSDCLKCQLSINSEFFSCVKCPLNKYYQPMLKEENGQCIECPELCEVCEERSEAEIYNLNPNFKISELNAKYITKCIRKISNPNVHIDPYFLIAKYCFAANCNQEITIELVNNFDIDSQVNVQYFNQIGITNLSILINKKNDITSDNNVMQRTELKSDIFSLRFIRLVLNFYENKVNSVMLNGFDFIEINDAHFQLKSSDHIQFENENQQVSLQLTNIAIQQSSISNVYSIFHSDLLGDITLKNIQIMDSNFSNTSLFNFNQSQFRGIIKIENISFQQCNFTNSQLFVFFNNQIKIHIEKLVIDSCQFVNSSFITLLTECKFDCQFKIDQITLTSNQLLQSYFLNSTSHYQQLQIINFIFEQNLIEMSTIIGISSNITLLKAQLNKNNFIDSYFLTGSQDDNKRNINFNIKNLLIHQNDFKNSILFYVEQTINNQNLYVQLKSFIISENLGLSNQQSQIILFYIQCYQLDIENIQIINSNNFLIFYLLEINKLFASNIVYETLEINYKISPNLNCVQQNYYVQNSLLFIHGFNNIIINNIKIYQQLSFDQSLLQIQSSRKNLSVQNNIFQLTNLQFIGNLLIKQSLTSISSLITIESEYISHIKLENSVFVRNFLHSYSISSLEWSIKLISIISQAGLIEITNFSCQENALTNSSNSFLSFQSKIIRLTNYSITNLNVLPQETWKLYYDIQIDMAQYDQEETNLIIQQILTIKCKSGAGLITSSTFFCFNCLFENIIGQKSQIFEIRIQEEGDIQFINLTISSLEYDLSQIIDSSGCITIDSSNSLLNLKIFNAIFQNVFNRMAASIFTIFPSVFKNEINIQDVLIMNSISLQNTIINLQFSSQNLNQNRVIIRNMTIQQDQDIWIKYLKKLEMITQSEIEDISSTSIALIQLKNCQVVMQNILIQGIFSFTLIKLINISKLFIYQFQMNDVTTFSQFSLFELKQDLSIKQTIEIKFFSIQQFKIYEYSDNPIIFNPKIKYMNLDCNQVENTLNNPIIYNFQDFFGLAYQNWRPRSIIDIQTISNETILLLDNILFSNIHCAICTNGIFYLNMENYSSIIIRDLMCKSNIIQSYGCLNIVSQIGQNQKLKILNSNFISNFGGTDGAALHLTNISISIIQCKILKNSNVAQGALDLEINQQALVIQDTIILDNEASNGPGICLHGEFNIQQENLIRTYLYFNRDGYNQNNIFEFPTHLSLFINSQEMQSEELIINNITVRTLLLKPYKIIEQGVFKISSNLMIPSDQTINQYKVYIPALQISMKNFDDFSIKLKNSRNELVVNQQLFKCQISQTTLELNQDFYLNESQVISILETDEFGYSFDLGSVSFHLNPFQAETQSLQILINCSIEFSNKNLYYLIKASTYKCQLGEFYIDEGCQICESIFGFYSVTYNVTKCSIFDKMKFANITSNSIQLLEGYWRPNKYSDYTEICLKNFKFCKGGWTVGNELCSLGHIGGLCEECDSHNIRGDGQFFKNYQNAECFSCSTNTFISFTFTSLWAIIMIVVTLRSIEKSNQLFFYCKLTFKPSISKIIFKLGQDMESIFIKMVLNYLWIYSVIFTFNINFSISLSLIESTSNASQFMAFSLDCFLSTIFNQELIYVRIITTFLLILCQFIIIQFGYHLFTLVSKGKFKTSFISNTVLYLYVSNYSSLIKQFCSIVSARLISNVQYLQGDLSLIYGSQNHYQWMYLFAIPGLAIFGLIIPLFFFFLLFMNKGQLVNIKFRRHTCYLFNEYNQESFFWEQIKFFKKTSIILVMTYFESTILFKASLLGLCLLVYQLMAAKQQPYILSSLNNLDLQTGQICSIVIFIATAKYVSEQQTDNITSQILQVMLILLFIKLCSLFIFDIFRGYAKKYKISILTLMHQFLQVIAPNSGKTKSLSIVLTQFKQKQVRLKFNYQILRKASQECIKNQKCNCQGTRNQSLPLRYQQYETSPTKYLLTIEQ
ncbi:unnamed protein product [Paramecium octaurelia]|uniref:Transmembrane protein n=1 Tax=Paramecium octaurelia TaxID=43137 RepID=A0A8S1W4N6_PAROT|nr:unnamed protein product [Paramecium octaurelia]